MGSDHYVLDIAVRVKPKPPVKYEYVDWDLFRKIRAETAPSSESYKELITNLKQAVKNATKEISTELEVPKMDSRLAHLLEAKHALRERWKIQKLNRRLRAKLTSLNKEIECYSKQLALQQWDETCNETDGRMRRGSKWNLLKSLLNDKQSRNALNLAVDRLIHKQVTSGLTNDVIVNDLARTYLPSRKEIRKA